MQKLKLVILRKIESKFKDSKYVADSKHPTPILAV